jgi:ketosteroid isomerase-like protein
VADSRGNAETIRAAYRLWSDTRGGSVATWLELFADDVVIRSLAGEHAAMGFARGRRGKGDAERYFAELAASWEIVSFEVEEILADGDRVVVLSQVACRSRAAGKVARSPKADVFRFSDGKVVEFLEFFDTAAALAATQPDG